MIDWLKQVFIEVLETVWREHSQSESYVSLEHHIRGKEFRGFTGYRSRSFHFRSQVEALFKIKYNPKLREVTFGQASFGPHLSPVSVEYWMVERGRCYRVAPLISREHQHLGDVKALLREPSGMRYADYSQAERPLYGRGATRVPVAPQYRPFVDRGYAVQLLRQVGSGEGEETLGVEGRVIAVARAVFLPLDFWRAAFFIAAIDWPLRQQKRGH